MDINDREIVETSFQRKGSIRHVLPSSPQGDSLLNVSARMVSNNKLTSFSKENYSQYFLEYNLISEYNMVSRFREKYSGVYVIPSAASSLVWFGIIFVRSGIYEGGAFRFLIFFTDQFPNGGAPSIVFENNLFHPAVDEITREFDVKAFFPDWRKDVNHVHQVLVILKQILHCLDARSFEPVNKKAAEMYSSDKASYQARVKQDVEASRQELMELKSSTSSNYSSDPHYIRFSQFDPEVHGNVLATNEPKSETVSISWVQPGSLEPFSKPHY